MKTIKRESLSLRWLKNDLRNEALKEKDEKLEKKLWRWYYRAKDAEYEVDNLVLGSDVRDLLKAAVANKLFDAELLNLILELVRIKEAEDNEVPPPPSFATKSKSRKKPLSENDDPENGVSPRQLRFWD